jgi:LAO/AO transport system kinase
LGTDDRKAGGTMNGRYQELLDRARVGESRAIGLLISRVEDGLLDPLPGRPATTRIVGFTGPPGAGKSTLISALIPVFRQSGRKVAVLCLDPSSPFSGGALLGDRIRMQDESTDAGVFVRSMASRGRLGGLARAVPGAIRVLAAAGFDLILVETVGVGQSEVDVCKLADTTVVVLAPGAGDEIQVAKAGVLEIADIYVVNKSDQDGAATLAGALRGMVSQTGHAKGAWRPPVLPTSVRRDENVGELVKLVDAHIPAESAVPALLDDPAVPAASGSASVTAEEFSRADIRVGRVIRAESSPKARKPAYKLWIDFGELGVRKSSAQITEMYRAEELIGREVVAVVNLPPRQIADFISEVLVLGVPVDGTGEVVLLKPDRDVEVGARIA